MSSIPYCRQTIMSALPRSSYRHVRVVIRFHVSGWRAHWQCLSNLCHWKLWASVWFLMIDVWYKYHHAQDRSTRKWWVENYYSIDPSILFEKLIYINKMRNPHDVNIKKPLIACYRVVSTSRKFIYTSMIKSQFIFKICHLRSVKVLKANLLHKVHNYRGICRHIT